MSNIEVTINGEQKEIDGGLTVLRYLEQLGIKPDRVAVELNRAIVKKAQWPSTTIENGAALEIVHFVGGG